MTSCCCRYPVGGDTLSVSTGVISRIEVTSYAHGSTELLAVQIDAAINSGNSGELSACPILQPSHCSKNSPLLQHTETLMMLRGRQLS